MNITQKTAVILALLFISSAMVILLIIYPAANDIIAYNARIQTERAALENKYTNRRNIKNVIADIHFVNEKFPSVVGSMLIERGGEVKFLGALEAIAAKYSITQKITLNDVKLYGQGNILNRHQINIVLAGNYINILRYISAIEQLDYYININNLNIGSGKNIQSAGAESSGDVKANLQGYVYASIQ